MIMCEVLEDTFSFACWTVAIDALEALGRKPRILEIDLNQI